MQGQLGVGLRSDAFFWPFYGNEWAIVLLFAIVYHDRDPRSLVIVVIEEHGIITDASIFLIDPAYAQYKAAWTVVGLA